jgi:hypothetical protein
VSGTCRNVSGLTAFHNYTACFTASDAYGNQQAQPTLLTFNTADSSPPQLSTSVAAGSLQSTFAHECKFSLQLSVSEAADVAYAVLRQDGSLTPSSIEAAGLFDQARLDSAASGQVLVSAIVSITTEHANLTSVDVVAGLPCGAQLLVWAAAKDLTGNIGRPASILHVSTPDVVPPAFVLQTPLAAFDELTRQAQIKVALDEAGTVACVAQTCWPPGSAPCHGTLLPLSADVLAEETLFAVGSTSWNISAADTISSVNITIEEARIRTPFCCCFQCVPGRGTGTTTSLGVCSCRQQVTERLHAG